MWGEGACKPPSRNFFDFELFYVLFEATWARYFSKKLSTKINSSKAGDPLKINFLSLASVPWKRPCLSHKKKEKKNMQHITKRDVKVMTHLNLNFGRINGKPAAVTSWGLGDVGGKLRLWGGGGGNLRLKGNSCPHTPQHHPDDAPALELCLWSINSR